MFRVKTSSDNNETFSQEMNHKEHCTWVREAHGGEFLVFAAQKQSVINTVKTQPSFFKPLIFLISSPSAHQWE